MNPGRELDALIAEKVMGWTDITESDSGRGQKYFGFENGISKQIPHFSKDISAAWKVVEFFEYHEKFVSYEIRSGDKENYNSDQGTSVYFCIGSGANWKHSMESAAHAICLAGLKALDHK